MDLFVYIIDGLAKNEKSEEDIEDHHDYIPFLIFAPIIQTFNVKTHKTGFNPFVISL